MSTFEVSPIATAAAFELQLSSDAKFCRSSTLSSAKILKRFWKLQNVTLYCICTLMHFL